MVEPCPLLDGDEVGEPGTSSQSTGLHRTLWHSLADVTLRSLTNEPSVGDTQTAGGTPTAGELTTLEVAASADSSLREPTTSTPFSLGVSLSLLLLLSSLSHIVTKCRARQQSDDNDN